MDPHQGQQEESKRSSILNLMEVEPLQPQQQQEDGNINSSVGAGSKVSFLSKQSSTRWIPTSDQIRILKELYYNEGIRSPNADQIQKISARLRQYGKVEGKNVFYWFQNYKARERQKKRLNMDATSPNVAANSSSSNSSTSSNKGTSLISSGVSTACSSPGFYTVFHMDSSGMSYRPEYCNMATAPWMQHYLPSSGQEAAATMMSREIETLPLFPINTTQESSSSSYYSSVPYYNCVGQPQEELYSYNNTNGSDVAAASLELTLNSYAPSGSN